ncbi:hypothetical protein [Natrinema versiforme]|uniref:Uncharacterized protein n=1 Tax=Natrinema versiforme TaxID=88724 RepID=A0A4P8WPG0_9EURY|nr:hypothetical protein [Natrinema versiforme]QCS43991.1 hypothetical protein FEJ81_17190 [Natrinema versiforme]
MTRRRNRFGAVLVVAITIGLLATVAGTGAVAAAEEQSVEENVSQISERESINEVTQESLEVEAQNVVDDSQSDPLDDLDLSVDVPTDLGDVSEDPEEAPDDEAPTDAPEDSVETPEEPTDAPDDPFAGMPEWISDGLF